MISILPVPDKRPVNPQDLNLSPNKEKVMTSVIIDGRILHQNLKHIGKEEEWLRRQLKEQWNTKINDIFLATYDSNKLDVYVKLNEKPKMILSSDYELIFISFCIFSGSITVTLNKLLSYE